MSKEMTCNINDFNKLTMALCIQYETIEHKGKEYKTADILDGLLAAAQYYSRAGRNTPKTPQNDPNIPVREEMTVAQLRTLLKQGDNDARELVNDLVSELPNQITVWIDKDDARDCADYLSDSQFAEFWYWMRHEWDVLCDFGGRDEIRAALEHWSTIYADELDE